MCYNNGFGNWIFNKKQKTASCSVLSRKKEKVALIKPSDIVKPKEAASCLQGRRALTVPKEPKFHSIHVPKSCTTRKPT